MSVKQDKGGGVKVHPEIVAAFRLWAGFENEIVDLAIVRNCYSKENKNCLI